MLWYRTMSSANALIDLYFQPEPIVGRNCKGWQKTTSTPTITSITHENTHQFDDSYQFKSHWLVMFSCSLPFSSMQFATWRNSMESVLQQEPSRHFTFFYCDSQSLSLDVFFFEQKFSVKIPFMLPSSIVVLLLVQLFLYLRILNTTAVVVVVIAHGKAEKRCQNQNHSPMIIQFTAGFVHLYLIPHTIVLQIKLKCDRIAVAQ